MTTSSPASTRFSAKASQITLGFTANLNVELTLATLQETVTVTGDSPVIDTTLHPRAAELQAGTAPVDSERP